MEIIVVGAGAAGMMAAGTAAEQGAQVTLIEKNEKVGRKLYITGKGRCNVCNDSDARTVIEHTPVNPRFLFSALDCFGPCEIMQFFEGLGVPLKTERGNRVFPVSDKAADVIDALLRWLRQRQVNIVHTTVDELLLENERVVGVRAGEQHYLADRVILATGGVSYPQTGSTGDGYRFAKQAGHSIVPPKPSLVGLVTPDPRCPAMMGLSLRNVQLTAWEDRKKVFSELGEMLFTHYGMSGPLILSASAHMRHFGSKQYRVELDLKPALDEKKLDKRLLADFAQHKNSDFINALGALLPQKMIAVFVQSSGIDPRCKVNSITKGQRAALVHLLKHFTIEVSGKRPVSEGIVTSGGVTVREVNPKTMESKQCDGLYFAGELLDVDAYTGGYNLTIAWATGRLAGMCAAQSTKIKKG